MSNNNFMFEFNGGTVVTGNTYQPSDFPNQNSMVMSYQNTSNNSYTIVTRPLQSPDSMDFMFNLYSNLVNPFYACLVVQRQAQILIILLDQILLIVIKLN